MYISTFLLSACLHGAAAERMPISFTSIEFSLRQNTVQTNSVAVTNTAALYSL